MDILQQFDALVGTIPPKQVDRFTTYDGQEMVYRYPWGKLDRGSPWRVRAASASEETRWPELALYRLNRDGAYLLWEREGGKT